MFCHVCSLSLLFVVAFVRGIFPGAEEPGRQDLEGIAIHSLRTRYPGHHAGSQVTDSAEIRRHQHAVSPQGGSNSPCRNAALNWTSLTVQLVSERLV